MKEKVYCWWQESPGAMYRPLEYLENKHDIGNLETVGYRLWRRKPFKFLRELVLKRKWHWLVSMPSYDKSIIPHTLVSKFGKESILFTSHVDWDEALGEETPLVRRFWRSYINDDRTTIVTVTEAASEGMKQEMGVEADKVIPHCCDTDVFYPREVEEADRPTVLFVGRFVPEKNINLLLDLAHKNPEIDFWFCGDGELKDDLLEAEKRLENVSYEGYISDKEDLAEYYSKADVLGLPSLRDGAITENFGIVVIEALACETPVVAYDTAGPESILKNLGVTVEHGNEEKFEEELVELVKDSDRAEELGRKGREVVKNNYDVEIVSEEWKEVLSPNQ